MSTKGGWDLRESSLQLIQYMFSKRKINTIHVMLGGNMKV